jgi:hypothetical protein
LGLAVLFWQNAVWIIMGGICLFSLYCVLAAIWHDHSRDKAVQGTTYAYATFNPPPYPDLDRNWNVAVNKYLDGQITSDELDAIVAEHRHG